MRTSVALCTYNGEKYIQEQLESIASQTVLPDEIVICDDGSTDNTIAIIQNFFEQHTISLRLYINERNLGFRKNFEKAISLCSNEIIFLCDQDDIWNEYKVSEFLSVFETNQNVVYAFSDGIVVDQNKKILNDSVWTVDWSTLDLCSMFEMFEKPTFPLGCLAAVRRNFAIEVMPFLADHDGWLALCAPIYGEVYPLSKKLIAYRRHANATSQAHKTSRLKDKVRRIVRVCRASYDDYFVYRKSYCDIYEWLINKIKQKGSVLKTAELEEHLRYSHVLLDVENKNFFVRLKALSYLKNEGLYTKFRSTSIKDWILDVCFMVINSFKKQR